MEKIANWPDTGCSTKYRGGILVRCSEPGCAVEKRFKAALPAATVRAKTERCGWSIDGKWKTARCPEHAYAGASKKADAESEPTDILDAASPGARAGMKAIRCELDKHYDDQAQCYEVGWTDELVAETTGMAVTAVAKVREIFYGPAFDPRVAQLNGELLSARQDFDATVKSLRSMAEEAESEFVAQLDALNSEAARVEREFQARVATIQALTTEAEREYKDRLDGFGRRLALLQR